MIGAGPSHLAQGVASVQDGHAFTAAFVEAVRPPFVAGAVVAQQHDQRVVEVACLAQMVHDLADALVHVLDHRRKQRHAAGEILPPRLVDGSPCGIRLSGEPVGDVFPVYRD